MSRFCVLSLAAFCLFVPSFWHGGEVEANPMDKLKFAEWDDVSENAPAAANSAAAAATSDFNSLPLCINLECRLPYCRLHRTKEAGRDCLVCACS
jgi:hypothetical protein